MILKTIEIKQGASLSLGGYINLPVATWVVSSQVRTPDGDLIADLEVELVAPVSPSEQYAIAMAATETETWPVGTLYCDIKFVDNNYILQTPTFDIVVLEAQTNG